MTRDNHGFNLYFIHTKHKENFSLWLYEKYNQIYAQNVISTLNKMITKDILTPEDIKKLIENNKINRKSGSTTFRVFLNYCEIKDIYSFDLLQRARHIVKLSFRTQTDTFVPTDRMIQDSLSILENKYPQFVLYYRFMIESSCRFTEFLHLVSNYDEKKIEIWNDEVVLCYRNFYNRHNKQSFYFFFSYKLYQEIKDLFSRGIKNEVRAFQHRLSHQKEIIKVKYLRKYNFTKMIEAEIPLYIAEFVQGGTSKSVE